MIGGISVPVLLNIARNQLKRCYFSTQLCPVKPGSLQIKSSVNINVEPAVLSSDLSFCHTEIRLISSELPPQKLKSLQSSLVVDVKENEFGTTLDVSLPEDNDLRSMTMLIKMPHHYTVDIMSERQSNVRLSSLETDTVKILMNDGNCELYKMRALDCQIKGDAVNLVLTKPFVGNIVANLKKGSITGEKVQGQDINMSTENGTISLNSLYAKKACLESNHGNVEIANCHGSTNIVVNHGDVKIKSLDGVINASCTCGDLDIHLTDYRTANIATTEGTANVTVPENTLSSIKLHTNCLDVDDSLALDVIATDKEHKVMEGTLGERQQGSESGRTLNVAADNITLKVMDWITSQKLVFTSEE